jgi:predicted RNase H-like nuclease (RuvC/YqgF family)
MSKDILQTIEKKYTTGENWVVAKGKVVEAKIIKTCYDEIKKLRKDLDDSRGWSREYQSRNYRLDRELDELQNENKKLIARMDRMKDEILKKVTQVLGYL